MRKWERGDVAVLVTSERQPCPHYAATRYIIENALLLSRDRVTSVFPCAHMLLCIFNPKLNINVPFNTSILRAFMRPIFRSISHIGRSEMKF